MTPSYDIASFNAALVEHGLIIPTAVKGTYGRGPVFEDILGRFNDLEHYVLKRDILYVEVIPSFGRPRFKIRFRARDGSPRTVELMLRRSQEFQSALNSLAT